MLGAPQPSVRRRRRCDARKGENPQRSKSGSQSRQISRRLRIAWLDVCAHRDTRVRGVKHAPPRPLRTSETHVHLREEATLSANLSTTSGGAQRLSSRVSQAGRPQSENLRWCSCARPRKLSLAVPPQDAPFVHRTTVRKKGRGRGRGSGMVPPRQVFRNHVARTVLRGVIWMGLRVCAYEDGSEVAGKAPLELGARLASGCLRSQGLDACSRLTIPAVATSGAGIRKHSLRTEQSLKRGS